MYFKLDKERKLRFGFKALQFVLEKTGAKDLQEALKGLEKGDMMTLPIILEGCLLSDNEGLGDVTDALDDYLEDGGSVESLMEVITKTFEESGFSEKKTAKNGYRTKKKK